MALIHGHGENDLPASWRTASDLNNATYFIYYEMIRKCYPSGKMDQLPTFKGVTVCEEWLTLSNFVRDLPEIPGYDDWKTAVESKTTKPHFITEKKVYSKDSCSFKFGKATRRRWAEDPD